MSNEALTEFLTALADDELLLGHRDAEWTGHAPILEEDIAFSNIAQDEIGHSLVWYTMLQPLCGKTPDEMGFVRPSQDFRCCRFVSYANGDFAHAVVRQFLFDEAERVRLTALKSSSHKGLAEAAARILPEEQYHLRHSRGLVERLGDATEESHRRMQDALNASFHRACGIFEELIHEDELVTTGVCAANGVLRSQWIDSVVPFLSASGLSAPVDGSRNPTVPPDLGGRRGRHTNDLGNALNDLQAVYKLDPGAAW